MARARRRGERPAGKHHFRRRGDRIWTKAVHAGSRQTFLESVAIENGFRCGGKAAFLATVRNDGISSAVVRLNGAAVFPERDFSIAAAPAPRPVLLGDTNALEVELRGGRPGGSIVLAIERVLETPVAPPLALALTGRRGQISQTVHVPAGGSYVLVVENGPVPLRSAEVTVNGAIVVRGNEVGPDTPLLRREVPVDRAAAIGVEAAGDAGSTVSVTLKRVLDGSACGPTVAIASPAARATVAGPLLLVRGTATGPRDLGVTVNDVAADLELSHAGTSEDPFRWLAEIAVPETSGTFTLRAVAADSAGGRGDDVRDVTVAADPAPLILRTAVASSPAPHQTTFAVVSLLAEAPDAYEIDFDGNGTVDQTFAAVPDQLTFTYTTPGAYVASLRAMRGGSAVATATAAVVAHRFEELDTAVRAVWTGFARALAAGDVDVAVALLSSDSVRERYRPALEVIRPGLAAYVASIQSIDPLELFGRVAHYLLRRLENGETRGYHVYFVRNERGQWSIAQF